MHSEALPLWGQPKPGVVQNPAPVHLFRLERESQLMGTKSLEDSLGVRPWETRNLRMNR